MTPEQAQSARCLCVDIRELSVLTLLGHQKSRFQSRLRLGSHANVDLRERSSGGLSVVVPPVPIPNTEVKRHSADGSASIGCARVGHRQNPTLIRSADEGFLLP